MTICSELQNIKCSNYKNTKNCALNIDHFCCLAYPEHDCIGQTKRHLVTRVNEHLSLQRPQPQSEIKSHIYRCNACQQVKLDSSNFEILKHCQNNYNTRIVEALVIKQCRPKLNKQLMTKGTSYLLKVF